MTSHIDEALERTAVLRAPVSDENPVGDDVSHGLDFDWVKNEIAKLAAPDKDPIDWPGIIAKSEQILATSKNLHVAVWYAVARTHVHGLVGLLDGMVVLRALTQDFWEGVYPSRSRARGSRTGWFSERASEYIDRLPEKPYGDELDDAVALCIELDRLWYDRLDDDFSGLWRLRRSLAERVEWREENAADEAERVTEEAKPVAVASGPELLDQYRAGARSFSSTDLSGVDLTKATLVGAKLVGFNLSGATLSGADLSETELWGPVFAGADMRELKLVRATLYDPTAHIADLARADLTGANVSRGDFGESDLRYAKLCEADLAFVKLDKVNLNGADLSNASLSYASLRGANLSRANLTGAVLVGTEGLGEAQLRGADLSGAQLEHVNMDGADLSKVTLPGATLIKCSVRKANLRGAELYDSTLVGADLTEADLSHANLCRATLNDAVLTRAVLTGARLSEADGYDAKLVGADLRGADLRDAAFTGADLRYADLSGADLRDAKLNRCDLRYARFERTSLEGTDFRGAAMHNTVFAGTDLSVAVGLDGVRHIGPSTIDLDTLQVSRGVLPAAFLSGVGLGAEVIKQVVPMLKEHPMLLAECRLVCDESDGTWAAELCEALRLRGVRAWLEVEPSTLETHIYDVQRGDVVILLASQKALQSWWLRERIRLVRDAEQRAQLRLGQNVDVLRLLDVGGHLGSPEAADHTELLELTRAACAPKATADERLDAIVSLLPQAMRRLASR